MKNLRQKLLACIALGLMASPAYAVPITFNFAVTGFNNPLEQFIDYNDVTSGLELKVTASTLYPSWSDYVSTSNINIGQYGQFGLGVKNFFDNDYINNQPLAVDGDMGFDRLNFSFNKNVRLVSADVFYYGNNTNFGIFTDVNNDPDVNVALASYGTYQFDYQSTSNGGSWGSFSFASLMLGGDLFGLGAGPVDLGPYSAFKLTSLTVDILDGGDDDLSTVPVPASLPLFGTGLALMGYLGMRRRKKAKDAA